MTQHLDLDIDIGKDQDSRGTLRKILSAFKNVMRMKKGREKKEEGGNIETTLQSEGRDKQVLAPGSLYWVDLSFDLSERPSNQRVFPVKATLESTVVRSTERRRRRKNTVLAESWRVGDYPYSSSIVAVASKLCFIPFYLSGIWKEQTSVVISAFDNFRENGDYPMDNVKVRKALVQKVRACEAAAA